MNMKIKKALADLKNQPGRTIMVVLALALGIWGMGTIFVSYVILNSDLDGNFKMTNPAQLILNANNFTEDSVEKLKALPIVESAEVRSFSLQRIEVFPNQWIPLWLYGVEDFSKTDVAHVFYQSGEKIPPEGSMVFERNGQLVSNLTIGSSAKVRVGGTVKRIAVTGVVFDPAQAPSTQDAFIYAYASQSTFESITGEAANGRLIVRLNNVKTKKDVEKEALEITGFLEQQGITLTNIDIPNFNSHPHQWQLNTILMMVFSVGQKACFKCQGFDILSYSVVCQSFANIRPTGFG